MKEQNKDSDDFLFHLVAVPILLVYAFTIQPRIILWILELAP